MDGQSYKTVLFENIALTIDIPDCYFKSKSKQIYQIKDIILTRSGPKLICNQFDKFDYAYYVPTATYRFESSELGILKLTHLNENLDIIDIEDFSQKCVVRVIDNSQYCYPLMTLN